ncbi:OvmZ protein [Streptomyces sp. NPDC048392]|uniref:OvmZ protein n=1 Tax=Streptomyces sp. NPDC048392 TaxID=3365543 RepID=UPI0037205D17
MDEHERTTEDHTSRDCARRCGRICTGCLDRTGRELRTLLALYKESDETLAAVPGTALRQRVSGSRGTVGIVLDERVVSLRSQVTETLRQWARLVLDERGGAAPEATGHGLGRLVRFLRQQLTWFADHPAGVDFTEEITELLTALGELFGPGPVRRFPLGPCPRHACGGTLFGVVPTDRDRVPSHVSCDTGHPVPPRQWLLLADRTEKGWAA